MTRAELIEAVMQAIENELNVDRDRIVPAARLADDLGADSLDQVSLVMELERRFDFDIPDEAAERLLTVGDVTDYLAGRLGVTP